MTDAPSDPALTRSRLRARWAAAISLGLAAAALLAAVVVLPGWPGVPDGPSTLLTFVIYAACFVAPCLALGWFVLVSPVTVQEDPHAEDTVENQWVRRAGFGAFWVLMILCGLGGFALSVWPLRIDASAVLIALWCLGFALFWAHYLVYRRRES